MEKVEIVKKAGRITHKSDDEYIGYLYQVSEDVIKSDVSSRQDLDTYFEGNTKYEMACVVYTLYLYDNGAGSNIRFGQNVTPPAKPETVKSLIHKMRLEVVALLAERKGGGK